MKMKQVGKEAVDAGDDDPDTFPVKHECAQFTAIGKIKQEKCVPK